MNRRRLLKLIGLPAFALLGGAAYVQAKTARNAYYSGPRTDHFDGVRFSNPPGGPAMKPFTEFLKWQVERRARGMAGRLSEPLLRQAAGARRRAAGRAGRPCEPARSRPPASTSSSIRSGRSARAPFTFVGPQARQPARHRLRGPAADRRGAGDPQPLRPPRPRHASRACGTRTGRASSRRSATTPIIRDCDDGIAVETCDWGAVGRRSADGVTVHLEPAYHWSARGVHDRRMALWCAYRADDAGRRDLPRRRHRLRRRRASSAPCASATAPPRARHPADRRLRAALVHAAAAHEPGGGRAGHAATAAPSRRSATTGARSSLTDEGIERADRRRSRRRSPARSMPAERFRALRPGEVWATLAGLTPSRRMSSGSSEILVSARSTEKALHYCGWTKMLISRLGVGRVGEIGHVFFDEDVLHRDALGVEIGRDRLVGGIDLS